MSFRVNQERGRLKIIYSSKTLAEAQGSVEEQPPARLQLLTMILEEIEPKKETKREQ